MAELWRVGRTIRLCTEQRGSLSQRILLACLLKSVKTNQAIDCSCASPGGLNIASLLSVCRRFSNSQQGYREVSCAQNDNSNLAGLLTVKQE